jgi:hypothetical protein
LQQIAPARIDVGESRDELPVVLEKQRCRAAARRDIVDLAIEMRTVSMAGEPLFQPA